MKIAFIGLGNMGRPMAINLIRAGYVLKVFDLDVEKLETLVALGATRGASLTECVHDADAVMTSLPDPKTIEALALGDTGILASMKSGRTWIELSTNNLIVERKIRAAAEEVGVHMLDAPVTGGTEGAAVGELTILVGGAPEVFARHEVLLRSIGNNIMHLGDHGAGYAAKIAQVVLCYLNSIALSEALMLGVKGGVDADTMLQVIRNSTGTSYVADRYGPAILDGSYDQSFALGLAHKDMSLTVQLAKSVGASLPMCEQVEAIYKRACDEFGAEQNHLMAIKLLEDSNATYLRKNH